MLKTAAQSLVDSLNHNQLGLPTVVRPNPDVLSKLYPFRSKESGESLERKRNMIAAIVVALAKTAKTWTELESMLSENFGSKLQKIGSGVSRTTYYLPYNLVIKQNHGNWCQNGSEMKANELYPDITCKVYGWVRDHNWSKLDNRRNHNMVNIVIAERARPIDRDGCFKGNPDYVPYDEYWEADGRGDSQLSRVTDMQDAHIANIGKNAAGNWVLLDSGCCCDGFEEGSMTPNSSSSSSSIDTRDKCNAY